MQGSVDWQVRTVFSSINDIGISKHEMKAEARAAGAKTWEQVGKALNCHSYSTYDDYRADAKNCFGYIKDMYGVRDILRIESYQVVAWLQYKIEHGGQGNGIQRSTFDRYGSSVAKLERALNQYCSIKGMSGKEFRFDLREIRNYAAKALGQRSHTSRAYRDPDGIVAGASGKYNLTASIQSESGARINEISRLHDGQLRGLRLDPHSNQLKGWIEVRGKGGKLREVGVNPSTYGRLKEALDKGGGRFRTNESNYRENLQMSAKTSGQNFEGSHGLRWNWAQSRHMELQKLGMSYEASLSVISTEMGHARSDITYHYLH